MNVVVSIPMNVSCFHMESATVTNLLTTISCRPQFCDGRRNLWAKSKQTTPRHQNPESLSPSKKISALRSILNSPKRRYKNTYLYLPQLPSILCTFEFCIYSLTYAYWFVLCVGFWRRGWISHLGSSPETNYRITKEVFRKMLQMAWMKKEKIHQRCARNWNEARNF